MRRTVIAAAAATAFATTILTFSPAQAQGRNFDDVEIKTTEIRDGLYMLEGRGGNIGASIGEDGVFLIDDQFAPLAPKILAAVAALSDQPVSFVINTHWHGDHTGGNEALSDLGAVIVAHDNVRTRMAAEGPRQSPKGALPVITFSETTTFHFNDDEIHAFHPSAAHTDGDSVIHFRRADVIHGGDVVWHGFYPFLDTSSGGSLSGTLAALETILALAGPETKVIPGHGPLGDKQSVQDMYDMLSALRTRVGALIAEGKTLREVQAADPMADYNAQGYGDFFITGEQIVEVAFNELSR